MRWTPSFRISADRADAIAYALVLFCCLLGLTPAVSASTPVMPADLPSQYPIERDDIEAWLDELIPHALADGNIPGGVVAIVKDGELLVARGFGYADQSGRVLMAADRTLIRPGSISKLFVWTAVMQLAERKQLDLDADINGYLDFRIPAHEGKPITLRQLMTHTPGFEEVVKDIMGRDPPNSLEHYIKTRLPRRIHPAGRIPAYSNYGTALAAYIVERRSGQSFARYAQRNILAPLGMIRSTFDQPSSAKGDITTGKGYRADGSEGYYEYIGPYPAGSLNTTATDMARFMIANLPQGLFDSSRTLGERGASDDGASDPWIFPALNGMSHGFYETTRNGVRSIAHNGGTQFFHSDLHLIPSRGIGLFISLNSPGREQAATRLHNAFFHGFMDRYFPGPQRLQTEGVPEGMAKVHAAAAAGQWESSQRSASTWLSLAGLLGPIAIASRDDGSISLPFPGRGEVIWREVRPWLWQSDDLGDRIQAIVQDGKPVMLGFDAAPPIALLPVPWWRSPAWLLPALGAALSTLLIHALCIPARLILRWSGYSHSVAGAGQRRVLPAGQWLGCVLLLAVLAFPLALVQFNGDLTHMSDRTDGLMWTLQGVTLGVLIGASVVDLWSVRSARGAVARIGPATRLLAYGIVWWTVIAFNLVNFDLSY